MIRLVGQLAAIWALIGGAILIAIMLVTSVNIGAFSLDRIARLAGMNVAGLPGYEDFVRLAIAGAACMFLPLCQYRRGHVTVDLFTKMLSDRSKRALDQVWLCGTVVLALFLAYWMTIGMTETRQDNALSQVLGWQEWPFFLPGIVSLLLWAIVAALQIFETAAPDA